MGIGVITQVETDEGTVDVTDITADKRREWAESLATKISALDGVESASLSSLSIHTNNQTGSIEVMLPYSEPLSVERTNRVKLESNTRSVSPRIRNVFENMNQISTFTVDVTPECHDESNNEYYTNYYIISFAFV